MEGQLWASAQPKSEFDPWNWTFLEYSRFELCDDQSHKVIIFHITCKSNLYEGELGSLSAKNFTILLTSTENYDDLLVIFGFWIFSWNARIWCDDQ